MIIIFLIYHLNNLQIKLSIQIINILLILKICFILILQNLFNNIIYNIIYKIIITMMILNILKRHNLQSQIHKILKHKINLKNILNNLHYTSVMHLLLVEVLIFQIYRMFIFLFLLIYHPKKVYSILLLLITFFS